MDNGSETWNFSCKSDRNDHQNVLKPSCDSADCFLIYGDMRALNAYKLPALGRSIGLARRFQTCIRAKNANQFSQVYATDLYKELLNGDSCIQITLIPDSELKDFSI